MRGKDDRIQPCYQNYNSARQVPLLIVGFADGFRNHPYNPDVWPMHVTEAIHIKEWVADADRPVRVVFLKDWAYLKQSERIMAAFLGWRNEFVQVDGLT